MNQIHVGRNGAALGVFSEEEVRAGIASGRFLLSDLGWSSGMAQWKALGEWPEFTPLCAPPPAIAVPVPGEPAVPEPAWERREQLGAWRAFWQSVFGILFSPAKTFASMPKQSGLGAAYIFYLIPSVFLGVMGQLIQLFLQLKYTETWLRYFSDLTDNERVTEMINEYLRRQADMPESVRHLSEVFQVASTIIGGIIGAAIGVFISAGIIHLLLMLFRGAKRPFITTFKTVAYVSGGLAFFSWLPGVGGLAALIWGSVLLVIALSKTHEIPWKKAALAVYSPILFCCCMYAGMIGGGILIFQKMNLQTHSFPPPRHTTVPAAPVVPDDDEARSVVYGK